MSSIGDPKAIENLLHSKLKLERDRGIIYLKQFLSTKKKNGSTAQDQLLQHLTSTLSNAESSAEWEPIQGCLSGAKCMIDDQNVVWSSESLLILQNCAKQLLTHDEVRVRLAAGELLGSLCRIIGPQTYVDCSSLVLGLVRKNLQRQHDAGLEPEPERNGEVGERKRTSSVDAATIFHESAGWRHLETGMKCLQFMIEQCGKNFNPYVDQELLDLIFTALTHENRFVRETGFYVCASLVNIGQATDSDKTEDQLADSNSVLKYGDQFALYLAKGLADNWSQVRLSSSNATRFFLLSIPDQERRKFYPLLLPRICLNRYYVAEGVRIYNQESWKRLTEGKGRDLVAEFIDDVVEYYVASTKADNHAVREAACACIAELGGKINPIALKPHVSLLLKTLLECFRDDSWPVRDAACVACGNFLLHFQEEAADIKDDLYRLFLVNLRDPISSVRQGAAGAVANYATAYGDAALDQVLSEVDAGLKEIENQEENTEKYSSLDKSPAQFGVVKKMRDNDIDLHSNQTMYSCGSLAPKMGRGKSKESPNGEASGSRGGCSDCRFQRPSEPWERSDGSVYLITEILSRDGKETADPKLAARVSKLLPAVVQATERRHFTHHVAFIETICKQLPIIGKRLGKKIFKPYLESFFETIFYALKCDTQLTKIAAEDCLIELGKFLGPSILRGRIEACSPGFLVEYDMVYRKHFANVKSIGASPGSLTPFPKTGFFPVFPKS